MPPSKKITAAIAGSAQQIAFSPRVLGPSSLLAAVDDTSDSPMDSSTDSDSDPKPKRKKGQAVRKADRIRSASKRGTSNEGLTSNFKGVGKHRNTGRWEAHLWDKSATRGDLAKSGRKRGKQVRDPSLPPLTHLPTHAYAI